MRLTSAESLAWSALMPAKTVASLREASDEAPPRGESAVLRTVPSLGAVASVTGALRLARDIAEPGARRAAFLTVLFARLAELRDPSEAADLINIVYACGLRNAADQLVRSVVRAAAACP